MKRERRILKERDREIIALIADGHNYTSISQKLGIKEDTLKKYIRTMMQEQGFTSPFQLITWAYQDAIIV